MNLLTDRWLSIRRRDGGSQRISLLQIADASIAPTDIVAARPDFRSALHQLVIGLLQTGFAPQDTEEWVELWQEGPSPEGLAERLQAWQDAFELDPEAGPAFMQDLDPLAQAEPVKIARLLIDNPGDKTVADSNDHFIHAGGVEHMCPACAATALFTLQINAPSGGAGHRVSVRGGGPLTALCVPGGKEDEVFSLWKRCWVNVLPKDFLGYRGFKQREDVMPWLGPTRTSETSGASDTTPAQVHELQVYWSMPRRIRLDWSAAQAGVCDLCGEFSARCISQYRTQPWGVNYTGDWVHPLTPYSYDAKQNNLPLSIKGQRGGIGYRDWAGLTLGNPARTPEASANVRFFARIPKRLDGIRKARLWCAGYDMDNMKSRCWYDAMLPMPTLPPAELPALLAAVTRVLGAANDLAFQLRRAVGNASREGKADPVVGQSFWDESKEIFYRTFLDQAMLTAPNDSRAMARLFDAWLLKVTRLTLQLFDRWVLAVPELQRMEQVVEARARLHKSFYLGKCLELRKEIAAWTEEVVG